MSRSVQWTFAAVSAFLFLTPLVLPKPGLPMTLKADEPAYYLMALSLVHDRDLVCDVGDIERLAVEFPYLTTKNLILATADGWRTALFGKPYLVSLVAAPLVAAFGANGFVATNMALLLGSIWLGTLYLRQYNSAGQSLLFATGFFLLSNAFTYVFWLHTEILCLAAVTVCLYLAFTPAGEAPRRSGRWARWRAALWNATTRPFFSGAAIVFAAYNKPYLALLGVPALWQVLRLRGRRGALVWLAGAVATGAVVCAISVALIGKPSAYLGLERAGVPVASFDRMPPLPEPRPVSPISGPAASWRWIFYSFRVGPELLPNLAFFLVGRHTGLLLYAPFVLLSLALFALFSRRSASRWLLLACLAGVALYTLVFIWFNWHGGGGFVGNRYYVAALPGFLFLVTRIAPEWLPVVGYALAGLFVGGIFLTPFGAPVPHPTLQAHTRGAVFQLFPFEHTLSTQIPGYRGVFGVAGSYLLVRSDQAREVDHDLWIVGGQRVEIDLRVPAPLARPVFDVATRATPNRVAIALGGSAAELDFDATPWPENRRRLVLAPGRGEIAHHRRGGGAYHSYRLTVEAERQTWHAETVRLRPSEQRGRGADEVEPLGEAEPEWEEGRLRVLVGAIVTFLGEEAELASDVYALDWLDVPVPPRMTAGRLVRFDGRIRNASGGLWRAGGPIAVSVAYRWLAEDGTSVVREGLRAALPRDLATGEEAALRFEIETPARPGRYELVLDGVRERIAWFSERRPGSELRRWVEVVPATGS